MAGRRLIDDHPHPQQINQRRVRSPHGVGSTHF
jgi:hypothetical protein